MEKPPDKNQHTEFSKPDPDQTDRNKLPDANQNQNDDDLDFVVTEEDSHSPQFVGTDSKASTEDDLGIETTADLMEQEAVSGRDDMDFGEEPAPFQSGADIPQAAQRPAESAPSGQPESSGEDVGFSRDNATPPEDPDRIERLSEDQVKAISAQMYQHHSEEPVNYLSEEEKMKLIQNLETVVPEAQDKQKGFDSAPIVPPKKKTEKPDKQSSATFEQPPVEQQKPIPPTPTPTPLPEAPSPKMAKRVRGLAFFHKNFIQLTGGQELREDDELIVAGREYALRKKQLSNKMLIGVVAPIAAIIIFFIGVYFSKGADTGAGSIIGVVLDDQSMPYITGAKIRLPELGKTYETNAQGFFKTEPIKSGSQKIEYIIDGQVIATDYATVVDGKVTLITLRPAEYQESEIVEETPKPSPPTASREENQSSSSSNKKASTKSGSNNSGSKSKKSSSSQSKFASLELAANVEGAKITVDGSVLGAGNLVYSKLKAGSHKYTVAKDGYQSVSGVITLSAGKTSRLEVQLPKATMAQKQQSNGEKEYYQAGSSDYDQGNYRGAVENLGEAIRLKPSYLAAYQKRADAYIALHYSDSAYADLVRAAEILAVNRDLNGSISTYNQAIELESKQVTAYLGRGNLYLRRGEEIAAITDFDMVVRLDKRNLQGYLGLGEARYNQGYYKKAAKHFRDARSVAPNDPEVHQYLMLSYLAAGDYKQVKKSYEDYAESVSAEELAQFRSDPQYGAVMKIVEE